MSTDVQIPRLFHLSSAPHIRSHENIQKIMGSVLLALAPATAGAVYFFGLRAFGHILLGIAFAVGTEALIQKLRKVPLTIRDLSAVITGLLVAFNVPAGAPLWISAVGGAFAIAVAKQAFGGLGFNFINPALAARAFLMAAWPIQMTATWTASKGSASLSGITGTGIDGVASATPLAALKNFVAAGTVSHSSLQEALPALFAGTVGGCLGETSVLLLMAGGIFLLVKRYINFRIPLAYIGSVFFLTWLFNGSGDYWTKESFIYAVFHVFAGGLILGAFFMATDMVTTPITPLGNWLFGLGCGIITVMIRFIGGYPEGVSYSILLMNIAAPLLDRIRMPRKYGERSKNEE